MQDIGAQQTGRSVEEFGAMLRAAGRLTMARIIGGIGTSHIPAIGDLRCARNHCSTIHTGQPFFDAFKPVRAWLESVRPDVVAVVVYNDHGLNFFLDKMPDLRGRRRQ